MDDIELRSRILGNRINYSAESLAREILESEFEEVALFFVKIFEKCLQLEKKGCKAGTESSIYFVAFITRRCHVLFLVYLDIFLSYRNEASEKRPEYLKNYDLDQLERIVKEHFVTDADILSMGGKIADIYTQEGVLPPIIVVDELLLHGRSLNQFLLKFEKSIQTRLENIHTREKLYTLQNLRDALVEAISLYVYAQNDDTLLLFSRYQKCLCVEKKSDAKGWRQFSKKIALLVSVSPINNVAYSWSFRIPAKSFPDMKVNASEGFNLIKTDMQNIRQDNYIWLYPDSSAPKAVCTVRVKESFVRGENGERLLLAVPFIIMGKRSFRSALRLHRTLVEELAEQPFSQLLSSRDDYIENTNEAIFYYRWISETNELLLSYMMFRKFWNALPFSLKNEIGDIKQYVDFLQISRNFLYPYKNNRKRENDNDVLEKLLYSIWDWEPENDAFEKYMSLAVFDAEELYDSRKVGFSVKRLIEEHEFCQKKIIHDVEDVIAEIGIEAERNAYEKSISGAAFSEETLSIWGNNYSLKDVLRRYCERTWTYDGVDMYQVIAVIVQAMDLGIIGMNARCEKEKLFTTVRAGEQSLFIKPIRYHDYITVLKKIDRKYGYSLANVKIELEDFMKRLRKTMVGSDKDIFETDELYTFLMELHVSGQSLEDWDFSMCDAIDKVSPRNRKEIHAIDEFLEEMITQMRYMAIYNGVY